MRKSILKSLAIFLAISFLLINNACVRQNFIEDKEMFVRNVPKDYLHYFNQVCPFFDHLKDVNVVLKLGAFNTTMQARPLISSILGERRYIIKINNSQNFDGPVFDDLPEEAKIGIIAHELCHILDYEKKSLRELLTTGFKYLSSEGMSKYEKEIDSLTVKHGFGRELKSWAQFAMEESESSSEYKEFKKQNYLTAKEIEGIMKK